MPVLTPVPARFRFMHPKHGWLVVEEHIPTEWGSLSTFFRCSQEGGEDISIHENVVRAAAAGEDLVGEAPVERKAKGKSSKLDRAAKHVAELLKDESLSNTKRISMLADKLRLSKSAATTYFYKVRNA